jgi:hypothetical protein
VTIFLIKADENVRLNLNSNMLYTTKKYYYYETI